jgi:hypothetical protein
VRFIILMALLAIGTEAVAQRRAAAECGPRVPGARSLYSSRVMDMVESLAITTRTGVNPQAKPLRAYGACSDHLSRITPRRRSLSGRTK